MAAFDFFGGVPARLVPDNLKTGVDKPDLYDPMINRSYAELAEHYGALVDPARTAKPKDKPRVERPIPDVRDSFWRGREFVSMQHMQEQSVVWCKEVAGRRSCRPLGGAAPLSVFEAGLRERVVLLRQPLTRPPELVWHIMEIAKRDNVTVQAFELGGEWFPAHVGQFIVYEYDGTPPMVYLEHYRSGAFLVDPGDVAAYQTAVKEIRRKAMGANDTAELIATVIKSLETT